MQPRPVSAHELRLPPLLCPRAGRGLATHKGRKGGGKGGAKTFLCPWCRANGLQRIPFKRLSEVRVCNTLREPTRKSRQGTTVPFKQASDQPLSPRRPSRKTTFTQTSVPTLKSASRTESLKSAAAQLRCVVDLPGSEPEIEEAMFVRTVRRAAASPGGG